MGGPHFGPGPRGPPPVGIHIGGKKTTINTTSSFSSFFFCFKLGPPPPPRWGGWWRPRTQYAVYPEVGYVGGPTYVGGYSGYGRRPMVIFGGISLGLVLIILIVVFCVVWLY